MSELRKKISKGDKSNSHNSGNNKIDPENPDYKDTDINKNNNYNGSNNTNSNINNIINSRSSNSNLRSNNISPNKIRLNKYPKPNENDMFQFKQLKLSNYLLKRIEANKKLNDQEEQINSLLFIEGQSFNNNKSYLELENCSKALKSSNLIFSQNKNNSQYYSNKCSVELNNNNTPNKEINIKSYSTNFNKNLSNSESFKTNTSLMQIESEYSLIKNLYNKVKAERVILKKNTFYIKNRVNTIEARSNNISLHESLVENDNNKVRKRSIENSEYKKRIKEEFQLEKQKQLNYSAYLHDSVIDSKRSARELSNFEELKKSKRKFYEKLKQENIELKKYKAKKADELSSYISTLSSTIREEKSRALNKKIEFLIKKKQYIGKSFINDIEEIIKDKKEILKSNSFLIKEYEEKVKTTTTGLNDNSIIDDKLTKCKSHNFNSTTNDRNKNDKDD